MTMRICLFIIPRALRAAPLLPYYLNVCKRFPAHTFSLHCNLKATRPTQYGLFPSLQTITLLTKLLVLPLVLYLCRPAAPASTGIPVERLILRLPCIQQAIQHLQFLRFSIQLISVVGLGFTRSSAIFLCDRAM